MWTQRRLATLEGGIKGGKWFRLIDQVWKPENGQSALKSVVRNPGAAGVGGQTAEEDHPAKVWEVATGRELLGLKGHTDAIFSATPLFHGGSIPCQYDLSTRWKSAVAAALCRRTP